MKKLDEMLSMARTRAVPYHNEAIDRYFLGNSIVGASGMPDGTWRFVIGPDYTCPNFIDSEKLYVLCDGARIEFDLQMKRIRKTGVFFGEDVRNGIRLSVFDFAPPQRQQLIRLIAAADVTGSGRAVSVCAQVVPFESEAVLYGNGIRIKKDTDCFCFGNKETLNWENRYCRIAFCGGNALQTPDACILQAPPGAVQALIHTNYYGHETAAFADANDPADPETALALLAETLRDWEEWSAKGTLPSIPCQRDADALESLLLCTKMQQNRDGGEIAGIYKYANSYVRDTHGCTRLYHASGHYEEGKKIILNIHSRWEKAGFIPNWWSMGSDTFIGHSFHNDASEVTAYYMFMVRDYLKAAQDVALLETVRPSLDFAAKTQLDWLRSHDFTMDFNGDETEQYCCNRDGEEYGGFKQESYAWNVHALSFPSMVAALASLEWYSRFLDDEAEKSAIAAELKKLRDKIDAVFCDSTRGGVHAWAAVPEKDGYRLHAGQLTNYMLFPLWIGAVLNEDGEQRDADAVKSFVRADGFLPNCPQAMQGFCGHTMGMYLDAMVKRGDAVQAHRAARQILDTPLLSMYGTVSEFYGPSCTPNGHMCRGFEGGITGQALISYFSSCAE